MGSSAERSAVGVVIVAAGSGRRFSGDGTPKQFWDLDGEPLLLRAIEPFVRHPAVAQVVVVLPHQEAASPPEWLGALPVLRVEGGPQRSDSVRCGLAALDSSLRTVLIHDAARPLVTRDLIDRVLQRTGEHAVIPIVPVTDTVKEVGENGEVLRTVPRDRLWRVQTPQAFPAEALRRVHDEAATSGFLPSDDAGLFERYGLPVRVVEGDPNNIKVTTQTDLVVALALARRLRGDD